MLVYYCRVVLPLKNFLYKVTLDIKVNNLGVEVGDYGSNFEFVNGINNALTDTFLRLTDQWSLNPLRKDCYEYG